MKAQLEQDVELCIEELSYNAKDDRFEIDHFTFQGVAILGKVESEDE